MIGAIATSPEFHNFLMQLFMLYECKLIIHIAHENATRIDHSFLSKITARLSLPLLELTPRTSYNTEVQVKACIVSFSDTILSQTEFKKRHKRPVKILLGSFYSLESPKHDYRPALVEFPPLVSLTLLPSGMYKTILLC